MMKLLLIGFFTFCVSSVFSQNNKLGVSDPDAKAILDKVSAKFKTYKTVTANFTLSTNQCEWKSRRYQKRSDLHERFKIQSKYFRYRKFIVMVIISGLTIKSANEVQLTKFDPSTNTITPQKMFTDFYDKDFLYKLNGEKKGW